VLVVVVVVQGVAMPTVEVVDVVAVLNGVVSASLAVLVAKGGVAGVHRFRRHDRLRAGDDQAATAAASAMASAAMLRA
jgi:hypothetical protein